MLQRFAGARAPNEGQLQMQTKGKLWGAEIDRGSRVGVLALWPGPWEGRRTGGSCVPLLALTPERVIVTDDGHNPTEAEEEGESTTSIDRGRRHKRGILLGLAAGKGLMD